jgi:hypothetical protein
MIKFADQIFFEVPRRSVSSLVALFVIYVSIYLKDWGSQWVNANAAIFLLLLGLLLGLVALVGSTKRNFKVINKDGSGLLVFISFMSASIFGLAATGQLNLSSYYIAIPCALIITKLNPNLFIRLLVIHFVISVLVQAFEYFSGQYLFIFTAADGTNLDETLFGGSLDVFRAKGMFQGPLSAVAFGFWIAFLFAGNALVASIFLLSAFFASGRFGMLVGVFILLFGFFAKEKKIEAGGVLPVFGVICGIAVLFIYADADRIFFIASALDVGNDQNVSRIYFWLTAISHYFSYSPINLVFGNIGFIQQQEGGTENDFLRLLLDCGFVGFSIYVLAVAALVIRAKRKKDAEGLFIALLIVTAMNIFPFIQSLSSAILFWLYFFFKMQKINRAET